MRSPSMAFASLMLLQAGVAAEQIGLPARIENNVLIIIVDDAGIDVMRVYDRDGSRYGIDDLPDLPNLTRLADEGILFRNAWVHPICSPTRSTIQTGRYPFRTGVGHCLAQPPVAECADDLQEGEWTIPEFIKALYGPGACPVKFANIGKWHLTCGLDWDDPRLLNGPNDNGYDFYAGSPFNFSSSYPPGDWSGWWKVVNGTPMPEPTVFYPTTDNVDDAHGWIVEREREETPWFLYLALNAPHGPFHHPPAGLHSGELPASCTDSKANRRACYLAALEAVDTELGRLFTKLSQHPAGILDRTTIIFLADNGTPSLLGDDDVTVPPFDHLHAKGTVYEGGVNVPLIIRSPVIDPLHRGCESDALVSSVDLFATSLELFLGPQYESYYSHVIPPGTVIDSKSFVPILKDPSSAVSDVRRYIYTEVFTDPLAPYRAIRTAVREPDSGLPSPCPPLEPVSASHKLVLRPGPEGEPRCEFYEVVADPFELTDYFDDLDPYHEDWAAYVDLCHAFNAIVDLDIECPDPPPPPEENQYTPGRIVVSHTYWPQPGHPLQVSISIVGHPSSGSSDHISLELYHPNGRLMSHVWSGNPSDLPASVTWEGRNDHGQRVASGRYLLRLRQGGRMLQSSWITVLR